VQDAGCQNAIRVELDIGFERHCLGAEVVDVGIPGQSVRAGRTRRAGQAAGPATPVEPVLPGVPLCPWSRNTGQANLSCCSWPAGGTCLTDNSRWTARASPVGAGRRRVGASGRVSSDAARERHRLAGRRGMGGASRNSQARRSQDGKQTYHEDQQPSAAQTAHFSTSFLDSSPGSPVLESHLMAGGGGEMSA
jgi:hypothetical protein